MVRQEVCDGANPTCTPTAHTGSHFQAPIREVAQPEVTFVLDMAPCNLPRDLRHGARLERYRPRDWLRIAVRGWRWAVN